MKILKISRSLGYLDLKTFKKFEMNGPSGIFTELADKVLGNVESHYVTNGSVSDDMLLSLHSVFGDVCERALTLLDSGNIVLLTSSTNSAKVYQVSGSSGKLYTIFPEINFCHCTFYTHQVTKGASFTCKHVLATRLAKIMGSCRKLSVTPDQFVQTLIDTLTIRDQIGGETRNKV